jgi:hypothetical protein
MIHIFSLYFLSITFARSRSFQKLLLLLTTFSRCPAVDQFKEPDLNSKVLEVLNDFHTMDCNDQLESNIYIRAH